MKPNFNSNSPEDQDGSNGASPATTSCSSTSKRPARDWPNRPDTRTSHRSRNPRRRCWQTASQRCAAPRVCRNAASADRSSDRRQGEQGVSAARESRGCRWRRCRGPRDDCTYPRGCGTSRWSPGGDRCCIGARPKRGKASMVVTFACLVENRCRNDFSFFWKCIVLIWYINWNLLLYDNEHFLIF